MVISSEPVRAVLFDMTGTLHPQTQIAAAAAQNADEIRSRLALQQSAEEIAGHIHAGITAAMREALSRPFYLTTDVFCTGYRYGLERLGVVSTADQVAAMYAHFTGVVAEIIAPQEGALEVLRTLRDNGIRTGIVSVNDERELQLWVDRCGLRDHLDFVLSSELARSCKPDRAIFEQALGLSDSQPTTTVFVGDVPAMDIAGANRAGMRSVLLTQGAGFVPSLDDGRLDLNPDYVVDHLRELLPLVL